MLAGRELQAFLYRVVTTNSHVEMLIKEGRLREPVAPRARAEMARHALDDFSEQARVDARRMGDVYELLYCLENSVRVLIESTLREVLGADRWWTDGVPGPVRTSAERRSAEDAGARWHGPRGDSLLVYVDFLQLGEIIANRWDDFEDLLGDRAWMENYFKEMNRTRRALAHTGSLSQDDVDWMEMRVKQWLRVVG